MYFFKQKSREFYFCKKSGGGLTFLSNFCVSSQYLSWSSLNKNKNKQKYAGTWFMGSQVMQNLKKQTNQIVNR